MAIGSAAAITIERIATPVADMHRTISRRWFRRIGPLGTPVRKVHDAVAGAAYASIRVAVAAAGIGVDRLVAPRPHLDAGAQAVVTGLWGDRLGRYDSRLRLPVGLRDRSGRPIALDRLDSAFPEPTGNLVFLVHGFADTERCWGPTKASPGLRDTLEATAATTPISVRYNTGRSIDQNGTDLARLLDACYQRWPVPVTSVALIGHSMGGLVLRSACTAAEREQHGWLPATSVIVTLGTPHLGTPIEDLVAGLAGGLGIAQTTAPLQALVETRSRGIRDLRVGGDAAPLLPGVAHHFVAGVCTSDPNHPVGARLGDLVVGIRSASGGATAEHETAVVVGGVRHSGLTSHPEIVRRVVGWLATNGRD